MFHPLYHNDYTSFQLKDGGVGPEGPTATS